MATKYISEPGTEMSLALNRIFDIADAAIKTLPSAGAPPGASEAIMETAYK